ncbi:MAG: polysaccharide deacetylase family protein [Meiothermus sp.]|uniref:polysaccharide deacetylase family protein n=1 Tax=Meiothermus sp. TaxID=1955249 RepID=UPI0025D24D2D|nr:polysaccharide deacetylase family protein [Meiothermus sp.]MCS7069291.1 polysaccharide deacetylase family protein [Meiothermus sp.]MDW8426601.1 polysaccharide deacetylase family protein [Meiothermus sp.]
MIRWLMPFVLLAVAGCTEAEPLPKVQRPPLGEVQPVAPGFRPPPSLPQIVLEPSLPGLRRLVYLSNGYLEAAHGLLLVPRNQAQPEKLLTLAKQLVERAFAARESLGVVDVSLYRAEDYAGFGGPLPLFTASVPRSRLGEFLRLPPEALTAYDHLWLNPGEPRPPLRRPSRLAERLPAFEGSPEELQEQQKLQTEQQRRGPLPASGLYYHGPPGSNKVALTFDDAVHPLFAPLLLDALRRAGVKATFFLIGRNAEAYPYFVRDLVQEGHELANHTYHHVRLVGLPEEVVRDELLRTNQLIERLTGQSVRFFRPPGGRYDAQVLRVARGLGLVTAFWTDDPGDFNNPGSEVIISRTLRFLRRGGIVLLHDNAQETLPVLGELASRARARGLLLTTLSDQAGW